MIPGRLAAIDVGTNTIRCIVVEADAGGDLRVLDDERAMVRLGEGLSASRRLSRAAFERAREALGRMAKIIEGMDVAAVEAVATSAVRKARNGQAFLEEMQRDTGIRIRVVSGREEAELAALSARHHFDITDRRYALADLGGGSVEVVQAAGEHIENIYSLELGAVFLTERFLARDPIPKKDLRRLQDHIRKQLRRTIPSDGFSAQLLIGSGGTVTALATMVMALRAERYDSVHGYEIMHSEVVHVRAMLERKPLRERRLVEGLSPERADIIVAGVTVMDCLMSHLGTNVLTVNERGIREGLILASLRKHGLLPQRLQPRDWRTAVDAFARSCHVEPQHSENVRRLALHMFDALAERFALEARDRELLESAALLHNVGYFISYKSHHLHAYHLIRHADLLGFTPREKEIVANVARYHRKALPKRRHEGFGKLDRDDRVLVRRLAGILRVADGLDRRRAGKVRDLRCRLDDDTMRVEIEGDEDLSVELYGGKENAELLERGFGLELEWSMGTAPA